MDDPKYRAVERQYFEVGELQEIWDYLHKKALCVHIGADELTPADRFAYAMLKPLGIESTFMKESENVPEV